MPPHIPPQKSKSADIIPFGKPRHDPTPLHRVVQGGDKIIIGPYGESIPAQMRRQQDEANDHWRNYLEKMSQPAPPPRLHEFAARFQFRLAVMLLCAVFGYIVCTVWSGPRPSEWSGTVRAFFGGSMLSGVFYILAQKG